MKLIIQGAGELRDKLIPRVVVRAVNICRNLPDGDLLTFLDISAKAKVDIRSFRQHATNSTLFPFSFKFKGVRYFGNAATVKCAKRRFKGHISEVLKNQK